MDIFIREANGSATDEFFVFLINNEHSAHLCAACLGHRTDDGMQDGREVGVRGQLCCY